MRRPHLFPALSAPGIVLAVLAVAAVAAAPALAAPPLSWSGALEVDHGQSITAVSCPSSGLCVAVDDAGRALLSSRPAVADTAAWSAPFPLPGAKALASISCPSSSLCVAVDREGHALVSTNPSAAASGAWSAAFPLKSAGPLSSVSCPSVSLCVAVSDSAKVSFSTNPAGGEGSWSEAAPLAGMGPLRSVSCSAATLCAAVDSEGRVAITGEPAAGASGWHARTIDSSPPLTSISCFAASCLAADGQGNALATPNAPALAGAGAGSGATWSSTLVDLGGAPAAVSCSRAGLCALVDGAGYALAADDATASPPSWLGAPVDPGHALRAVSCAAAGLCLASDASGRVLVGVLPAPTAATGGAGGVSRTTATLTGTAFPQDATLESCSFEYGHTSAYGQSVPCGALGESGAPQAVGAAISGLTAGTLYHYRLLVSGARGAGSGADATFQTSAPFLVEPHPSIGGTPAAGQRLTCRSGVSAAGVSVAYQWLRDTAPIAGATAAGYVIVGADVSHHLQCRVTATTEEGSRSATSSFVSVPAGGVGTIVESSAGTPKALGDTVQVPLRCSPTAAPAGCAMTLRLSARVGGRTVALGSASSRLAAGQRRTLAVTATPAARRLIARRKRLAVRLTVSGTVVGVIRALLEAATVTLPGHGTAASVHRAGSASASRAPVPRRRHAARGAGGATPASVLAPTPYMGWDTYFTFGGRIDEAAVLEQASRLRSRGLEADGYRYVWLDVGWWTGTRSPSGEITVSPSHWPHGMAWLAATLHGAGFRVGLYTDAGRSGCGSGPKGSYGHYQQDVNTFAAWGFDAVKVDFCGGVRLGLSPAAAYGALHQAIVANSSRRPMLLSICNYLQPGQFAAENPAEESSAFASYTFGPSSGNSWRTDTDVGVPGSVTFENVLRNLDADAAQPQAAGPGHWNDPDYLGPGQGMSNAQFRSQFTMWSMLAAPLMVSANMITPSQATLATLTNREAIAIDQDPAGLQGRLASSTGAGQVWAKPLADGSVAVALLNRGSQTLHIATTAAGVGLDPAGSYTAKNVWSGAVSRIGASGAIAADVAGGATVLLRVR